jgi:hypothetical protein
MYIDFTNSLPIDSFYFVLFLHCEKQFVIWRFLHSKYLRLFHNLTALPQ